MDWRRRELLARAKMEASSQGLISAGNRRPSPAFCGQGETTDTVGISN